MNTLTPHPQRQCTYYFPEKFKTPPVPTVGAVNKAYAGWNVNIDKLFFANGRRAYFVPPFSALPDSN